MFLKFYRDFTKRCFAINISKFDLKNQQKIFFPYQQNWKNRLNFLNRQTKNDFASFKLTTISKLRNIKLMLRKVK